MGQGAPAKHAAGAGGVLGLVEGMTPALLQYLQMKWPLLDVPAGATLKDSRSPSPAHLVRAARSHQDEGFPGETLLQLPVMLM